MDEAENAHDAALERIASLSPEYGAALSDHTPMVVEALSRLGRADAIDPYLRATLPKRRRQTEEPAPELQTFPAVVEESLRDIDRLGVDGALRKWLPEIVRGFSGAAFHGAIRAGHALRALSRRDTPARRAELARALAYVRLRSVPLPRAVAGGRARSLADALREIAPSRAALDRRSSGLISTAVEERAAAHPELAAFAGSLVLPDDPREALAELFETSVDLFVRGAYSPEATFTMLHGVTGMDSAIAIGEHLSAQHAHHLARGAAHALLALRIAFVGAYPAHAVSPPVRSLDEGRDVAVRSLDDHAIKLAAALQSARLANDDGRFAAALERWAGRFA